jgi:hypothetical protein
LEHDKMTTQELAVVQGEIVDLPAPLSEGKARQLDKQIKTAREKYVDSMDYLLGLIQKAAEGQIWVALGLPSMSAYLKENVAIIPQDTTERRALTEALAGKGFSNRTTADILHVDEATVRRDKKASGAASAAGATVEGPDGKHYPASQPKDDEPQQQPLDADEVPLPDTGSGVGGGDYEEPGEWPHGEPVTVAPESPEPKPQPVSQDFGDEMGFLGNSVESFHDIMDDSRFPKAAKTIAKRHLNDLQEDIVELQKVVDCLMEVTPDVRLV